MSQPSNVEKKSDGAGFAIVYIVIMIGMIALSAVLYFSWLSIFSINNSIEIRKSGQARYLADACAEIALQKIWDNSSFSGSGSFSGYGGSCTYVISNLGGENRQINSTGTVGTIIRKVKISVDKVNTNVNVASWREVADF